MHLLAQNLTLPDGTIIQGPKELAPAFAKYGGLSIGAIISKATEFIFGFAGLALLLMLIAGGFGILTSSGDAKKLASASQRLTYAILGFIIIFVAYWVVQLAAKILGLPNTGF